MYDPNRQSITSISTFTNNKICYYQPSSKCIKIQQKKPHHYEKDQQISQMIENISRQLFYYSNSLMKISSMKEQKQVRNILLENVKRFVIQNCDKYGMIPEQIIFFLILSYLQLYQENNTNLRQFLNSVHYLLTSHTSGNDKQQPPFTLTMLLNGQFQEILHYIKDQQLLSENQQMVSKLIQLLIMKIQQKEKESYNTNNNVQKENPSHKAKYIKIATQIKQTTQLKKIIDEYRKKGQSIYEIFVGKYELEIVLAVLAGNQYIIDEVAKGSWGMYLNLYINYVQCLKDNQHKKSYQNVVKSYLQKYFGNSKNKKSLNQNQEFLVKVLNMSNKTNRFSFHEIYQSSFNIFSPVLAHLVGAFLIQCNTIDLFSLHNNRQYHEQILIKLLQTSSEIGWTTLVNTMGYVKNTLQIKKQSGPLPQNTWQNLLIPYLPYEFTYQFSQKSSQLFQNQIKQIQQKIDDLNLIGLNSWTKHYLNTFFKLQLKQSSSNNKLNSQILQIFFMNLQIYDPNNANQCFHLMKIFMSNYYKTSEFNYSLLTYLENIFERKQKILNEKILNKIQKLFSLIYKIKEIKQVNGLGKTEDEQEEKQQTIVQVQKFNGLFVSSSKSKKSLSFCVELLKLASQIYTKCQKYFSSLSSNQALIQEQEDSQNIQQTSSLINQLKKFQRNIIGYVKQCKEQIKNANNSSQKINYQVAKKYLRQFQNLIY